MTIIEYLDSVKDHLLTNPLVSSFRIIRERATLANGHLCARLALSDGSLIEFSEYVQRLPAGQINVATYSYHWADGNGDLIQRWDNTPHFPDLPGFPHHVHDERTGTVGPGQPTSIFAVLDQVAQLIA